MTSYKYGHTPRERLLSRLIIDHETGCLLWAGPRSSGGYGQITANGRSTSVHQFVWELERGPVPPGMQIDHVYALGCRHRHCANMAHLELVTPRENSLRSTGPSGRNACKTHCDHGHPFDEVNTYWRPGGGRGCRECGRRQWRGSRLRRLARQALECAEHPP